MIDLREIRSVTEFQRNIKDYVGRLKHLQFTRKQRPSASFMCGTGHGNPATPANLTI